MSWSMNVTGAKAAVLEDVRQYFNKHRFDYHECDEPEEALRQSVGKLVIEVIEANPENVASLAVRCDGSAYTKGDTQISNSVQISVSAVAKY